MPPKLSPESVLVAFPLPAGLLGASMRRTLGDLNQSYLELCTAVDAAGDPRFSLREEVLAKLVAAEPDTLRRLVQCPFALFELQADPAPRFEPAHRISDVATRSANETLDEQGRRFTQAAFVVASRMTERSPLATRIAFGLPPSVDSMVQELSPVALLQAAARKATLRPRWRNHPSFWPLLLEAAQLKGGLQLQRVHSLGVRLLAAQLAAAPRVPARR